MWTKKKKKSTEGEARKGDLGLEIQRMRGDWIMRRGENKVTSEDILIFIPVFEDELPSGFGGTVHVRVHGQTVKYHE